MKALLIIFSVLLMLLLAGLWVGPGSFPHLWKLENRKVVQEQSNAEKKEQIRKIQAELDDVASGKDALEERARSELGMTKKGETFFEVVLQPEPKKKSKAVTSEAVDGAKNESTAVKPSKKDSSSIDIKTGND